MLFFMRSSCLLLLVAHTHAAPLDPQIEQRELHNEATVHHRFAAWAASHGWVKHEEPALLGAQVSASEDSPCAGTLTCWEVSERVCTSRCKCYAFFPYCK